MSFNSSNQSYRNGSKYGGEGSKDYGSGNQGRSAQGGYRNQRNSEGYQQDNRAPRDNRNPRPFPQNERFNQYRDGRQTTLSRSPSPQYRQQPPRGGNTYREDQFGRSQFFGRKPRGTQTPRFLGDTIRKPKFDSTRPVSPFEIGAEMRRDIRDGLSDTVERVRHDKREAYDRLKWEKKDEDWMSVYEKRLWMKQRLFSDRGLPERPLLERLKLPNNRNWMAGLDAKPSRNDHPHSSNHYQGGRPRRILI